MATATGQVVDRFWPVKFDCSEVRSKWLQWLSRTNVSSVHLKLNIYSCCKPYDCLYDSMTVWLCMTLWLYDWHDIDNILDDPTLPPQPILLLILRWLSISYFCYMWSNLHSVWCWKCLATKLVLSLTLAMVQSQSALHASLQMFSKFQFLESSESLK